MHLKALQISIFLFMWAAGCTAQNSHPAWINYTTDHGLPSPEVHYCLEGPEGYMWFATDNGLSRFDGYSFKNYGLKEGLKDLVTFDLQLDSKGRIWMSTLSGNLYYLQQDSIYAFDGNEVIQSGGWDNPKFFIIGKEGELILMFAGIGLLIFEPDGSHQLIQSTNRLGGPFLQKTSVGWIYGSTSPPDSLYEEYNSNYARKNIMQPLEFHSDSVVATDLELAYKYNSSANWTIDLPGESVLLKASNYNYEFQNGNLVSKWQTNEAVKRKAVLQKQDGSILTGLLNGGGLCRYQNLNAWRKEKFEQWLPEKTISNISEDSEGGIWVGTVEHGVFYCPDPEFKIYDDASGIPVDHISAIALGDKDEVYLGMRNGQVFHLNPETDEMRRLPDIPNEPVVYDLVFDKIRKKLWVGNNGNAYFQNDRWKRVTYLNPLTKKKDFVIGKKLTLRPGSHQLWGGHYARFGMIDVRSEEIALNSQELNLQGRTLVVWEASDSRIWLGRPDGLFEFRDSQLVRPEPYFPQFETRVDDLAELPGGTLVIATKGDGLLLWRDTFFQQITTENGLTSNMPENLHVDEQGQIWAGTLNGLNILRPNPGGHWSIEQMTIAHGLPSNVITDVTTKGDDVWVATDRGLVHFKNDSGVNESSPAPMVTSVLADRRSLNLETSPRLSFWENNLTVHFVTLNYRMQGKIPYRIRFDGGEWTFTMNTSVNFPSLPPGNRFFEVQSQNEDGVWSESATFVFYIAPPWWETWWAISGLGLYAVLVIGSFYKYRTSRLKKEIALQKQLGEVERQALRSQMNPHFVFNSLNAIQGYIAQGDKLAANRYLSRFAKLIRSALQHSRMTRVPLEDDVANLKSYIELEQLRFQGKFDFDINVAPDIDATDVTLPPMLVQPFVENAIVHGIANKEGKGLIEVDYQAENGCLMVIITDNGIGIDASKKRKFGLASSHKSIGLTVTKRRLEMLNGNGTEGQVKIVSIKNEAGETTGTQASIWIPLQIEE